jgi:hypothetical protein
VKEAGCARDAGARVIYTSARDKGLEIGKEHAARLSVAAIGGCIRA